MNVREFIERGGKIEFVQRIYGFRLTFPNGAIFESAECMDIDKTIDRFSERILSDRYEELFTPKDAEQRLV